MKKLIFFLFLTNLNAQEIDKDVALNVVEEIQLINVGKLGNSLVPLCTDGILTTYSNKPNVQLNALYNQCAIDLCGRPSKNISVYNSDDSFSRFLSNRDNKKIERHYSAISKVTKRAIDNNKRQLAAIKDLFENPKKIFEQLSPGDSDILVKEVLTKYVTIDENPNLSIDKRFKVKINPPSWADENFKLMLSDYAKNLEQNRMYDLDTLDVNISMKDQRIRLSALIKQVVAENKANPNLLINEGTYNQDFARGRFKQFQELEDSNYKNVKDSDIEQLYEDSQYVKNLLRDNGSRIAGSNICHNERCKNSIGLYFKSPNVKQFVSSYDSILNDPKTQTIAENRCKAGLIDSEITETNKEEAQALLQKSIELIKKNYAPKFSEHSRKQIVEYLDNNVILNKESVSSLSGAKSNRSDIFQESANNYLSRPQQKFDSNANELISFFFDNKDTLDQINPAADAGPCVEKTSNLWDAYLAIDKVKSFAASEKKLLAQLKDKDNIFISPFSCQHSDFGTFATTHELGHALNNFFKINKVSESSGKFFNETRNCITTSYKSPPPPSSPIDIYKNDSNYTEEDHADAIAHMTINDKKIYSCAFLEHSKTTDNFINLSFTGGFDDKHSSHFTRVVTEAFSKNIALPKSCQDLMSEAKPEMELKKCF